MDYVLFRSSLLNPICPNTVIHILNTVIFMFPAR